MRLVYIILIRRAREQAWQVGSVHKTSDAAWERAHEIKKEWIRDYPEYEVQVIERRVL